MKIKSAFLIILLLTASGIEAQTVIGKYAGEFLAIGVGARALGMGSALTAATNDVTSGYWNPAGLSFVNYPQISIMHEEHFGSLVNYNYAAIAMPYGKTMTFAFSALRLSVDGIPDTRNALIDQNTGRVIYDIFNPNARLDPDKITEFSDTDWAFFFSFAKKNSEKFSWGANLKFIYRTLAESWAAGIGFDVGAIYSPVKHLLLGANLMDVTSTLVAWKTGRNEIITPTIKLGSAYILNYKNFTVTPDIDLDVRFENRRFASEFNIGQISFDVHSGFELTYNNIFSVRAGYNDVKQFTVGAGIKLPKLNIDYSFARFNDSRFSRLPDSHRISLILTLEEHKYLRR